MRVNDLSASASIYLVVFFLRFSAICNPYIMIINLVMIALSFILEIKLFTLLAVKLFVLVLEWLEYRVPVYSCMCVFVCVCARARACACVCAVA